MFDLKITDNFSPFNDSENIFHLPIPQENIIFIDKFQDLDLIKSYFLDSKYLGIDTEWKPSINVLQNNAISIIQISSKSHCIIIDYKKLKNEFENFSKKFIEIII